MMAELRARQIVQAAADAAERWTDADFPPRIRATTAIVERTGYTEPVVEYALDRLFRSIDRKTLEVTIASELGSVDALDGFVAREGRPDVRYAALARVAVVSSDTTIGVAIPALVFAICAKSRVVVKDRDDRLVTAFAQTLAEERPELRERIVTEVWRGCDDRRSQANIGDADAVVAYGRTETLAAIRAHLRPEARFVPFGHRTSVAFVTRDALETGTSARAHARAAAIAGLLYDGEGCLSIHAVFVERGGQAGPGEFARLLADACDDVAVEFPAAYREPDTSVAAYRRAALFRASLGQGAVHGGAVAPHLVVFDPPRDEPPPFLRRTLAVYGVDDPAEALAFIRAHGLPLEAVGIGGKPRADLEACALASGASRIAPLALLQEPPLGGEHGGAGRILPFVRAIYRA